MLHGSSKEGLKTLRRKQLEKTKDCKVHLSMIHVCDQQVDTLMHSLTTHTSTNQEIVHIVELLIKFQNIFLEPTTLPPKVVGHDHQIPLIYEAIPIKRKTL